MEREEAPSAPGPQPGNTGAIAVRTNMNPLAAFSPEVKTGADGQASVALTLDNLKAAFAGESQANRRYLYFAKVADVEGILDPVKVKATITQGGESGTRGCRGVPAVITEN